MISAKINIKEAQQDEKPYYMNAGSENIGIDPAE
jgi:hypothetical protein